MWTEYMQTMLADTEEKTLEEPQGLERIRIDWKSGEPTAGGSDETLLEYFYLENRPSAQQTVAAPRASSGGSVGNSAAAAPVTRQQQKEAVEELF